MTHVIEQRIVGSGASAPTVHGVLCTSVRSQDSHLLIGLLRPIAAAVIGYFRAVKVELAGGERPSKPAVSSKHSPHLSITVPQPTCEWHNHCLDVFQTRKSLDRYILLSIKGFADIKIKAENLYIHVCIQTAIIQYVHKNKLCNVLKIYYCLTKVVNCFISIKVAFWIGDKHIRFHNILCSYLPKVTIILIITIKIIVNNFDMTHHVYIYVTL